MLDKYYSGVIEQIYNQVGKEKRNIVMANYSNDFSIETLDVIRRCQENEDDVFFAYSEFAYNSLTGAYDPFIYTICSMYRRYVNGNFDEFMQECGVYYLHRQVISSYYDSGICKRDESVLLNEVGYEQRRMTKAVADMLVKLSQIKPVVIVINRFQMASRSTLELVDHLIEEPCANIGIVLGVNESVSSTDTSADVWDRIVEKLEDNSQIYYIGSSSARRNKNGHKEAQHEESGIPVGMNYRQGLQEVSNTMEFLDYEQAKRCCQNIEHRIKFEDARMDDDCRRQFYMLYARISILLGELSKALELIKEYKTLIPEPDKDLYLSQYYFMKGTCYMYQGKLEKAEKCSYSAHDHADACEDEKLAFKAELLTAMTKMSGWYNIFFCVQDIPISQHLLEKLMEYGYKNHLAHIYIYAYDNSAGVVAKAYSSEAALFHFSKGVALAKEIGNEQLVYDAYQKTIMLASTNGMNEIALLYIVRTYEFMNGHGNFYVARVLSGIGYNLSAMGKNDLAKKYYDAAINLFYELKRPEDIAEVYYNRSLNYIMQGKYKEATHDLLFALKAIEKLHLNSLRVCNLSKVYALLALSSILGGDRFGCERYLLSCRQFLDYIIDKENNSRTEEIIHDYAQCDDEMFIYTFASAMLSWRDGRTDEAYESFENAQHYLSMAEGNEFFAYVIFRKMRMALFERLGKVQLYEHEREILRQHEQMMQSVKDTAPFDLLDNIDIDAINESSVKESQIEMLIKQDGLIKDYQGAKRQMEFVSTWQKLIDVTDQNTSTMVENAVSYFINHFNLDCALYIDFHGKKPNVLYNDTGCMMTEDVIAGICDAMDDYPQGFAVSKIGDGFYDHQDVISYFGMDEVCSFAAVPFVKNDSLTSVLIAYVRMKDNWHGSVERYMLNEDDLGIFKLLFREMEYSIARIEAKQKAKQMNLKLQQAAITDMLTGIYNRAGMYQEIEKIEKRIAMSAAGTDIGLMFIDLDNFKHYNDTYGHDIGDLILREMAYIFREVSKDKGFVSRYGGDEFIIILESRTRFELENIAKEIYARIAEADGFRKQIKRYLKHDVEFNEEKNITCSIGIAYAQDVTTENEITDLIKKADDLMYTVKTGEKGHYAFF
ncbi:diguanylate cyclase [Agathobacter sp.]